MSTSLSPGQLAQIAATLGVAVEEFSKPPAPHELYASANGDRWLLTTSSNGVFVRHVGNMSSGAHTTEIPLLAFLARDVASPQHQALVRLIDIMLSAHLAR